MLVTLGAALEDLMPVDAAPSGDILKRTGIRENCLHTGARRQACNQILNPNNRERTEEPSAIEAQRLDRVHDSGISWGFIGSTSSSLVEPEGVLICTRTELLLRPWP